MHHNLLMAGINSSFLDMEFKWWPETESNCRHEDFQSTALPTELSGHQDRKLYQKIWS